MEGGFRTMVNPPTPVDEIDLDDTREIREIVRELFVARQEQLAEPWHQPLVDILWASPRFVEGC
jgi:hypothetical protein